MSFFRSKIVLLVVAAAAVAGDFFTAVVAEESCASSTSTDPNQTDQPQLDQRDLEAAAAFDTRLRERNSHVLHQEEEIESEETNGTKEAVDENETIAEETVAADAKEVNRKPRNDWITRTNPHTGEHEEIQVGVEQILLPSYEALESEFHEALDDVDAYIWEVYDDPELSTVLNRCKDRDDDCLFRAMQGECDNDRNYMWENCAPSCKACDMLLYERRCPYDPDSFRALQPGDLNRMFARIIEDPEYRKYEPVAWSQPTMTAAQRAANPHVRDYPWVVSLENFLSDEEVERLLELAEEDGYEESDDGGEYLEDGTFVTYLIPGRTSFNSWCRECFTDPLGQDVVARIEEMTQIDRHHFEHLQMLRYEYSQHYHVHHDFDTYDVPRQPGPRVITFFLYLSDVEEGGGTNFPRLDLTFTPKKGSAVIWPNVLDEDPMELDEMTEHQALPVIKGTKYAANAWIHMHDWQRPNEKNCAE